jgi:hypothetical protein
VTLVLAFACRVVDELQLGGGDAEERDVRRKRAAERRVLLLEAILCLLDLVGVEDDLCFPGGLDPLRATEVGRVFVDCERDGGVLLSGRVQT